MIESAGDSGRMAEEAEDTDGCYVVPVFTGLGAPDWNPYARGMESVETTALGAAYLASFDLEAARHE